MKRSKQSSLGIAEQGQILQQYKLHLITKSQACQLLGISQSSLYRRLEKFEKEGIKGLIHGNTGRQPINRMEESLRSELAFALLNKYQGFQPALAKKYLRRDFGVNVSEEFIRQLIKEGAKGETGKSAELHPLRRRRSQFGELIQIDGSPHYWFGEDKDSCCLLVFIDDATGKITAAGFYPTECGEGYFELIAQHVLRYGIPCAFYSDRHSIFTTQTSDGKTGAEETETQYQRICNMLGITPIFALTPQAKGRVERLNQTLQGRWPKEFALRGIEDISTANKNLQTFINEFNEEFGVIPLNSEDAHRPLPFGTKEEHIYRICSKWSRRILSKQLTFSFQNHTIQVLGEENRHSLWNKEVFVLERASGEIEVIHGEKVLPIKILPQKELPKIEPIYETPKTIDHKLDKIMEKEKNRRTTWLNQRAIKAKKALDAREALIEAAEELVKELDEEEETRGKPLKPRKRDR